MALFTPILGTLSGKVAANVFSHNRFGAYVRHGPAVSNPNTPQQQAVRRDFGDLVAAWTDSLTPDQRSAWETYAFNTGMTNRQGNEIFLTGQNHFVRSNMPRTLIGATRVDDAPTIFNLGEAGAIEIHTLGPPDDVEIEFDVGQPWVSESGAYAFVQVSRPQTLTRNFFKGPFRFMGPIAGVTPSGPTSPAAMTSPFPFGANHRVFIRARVSRNDGRLSSAQIDSEVTPI